MKKQQNVLQTHNYVHDITDARLPFFQCAAAEFVQHSAVHTRCRQRCFTHLIHLGCSGCHHGCHQFFALIHRLGRQHVLFDFRTKAWSQPDACRTSTDLKFQQCHLTTSTKKNISIEMFASNVSISAGETAKPKSPFQFPRLVERAFAMQHTINETLLFRIQHTITPLPSFNRFTRHRTLKETKQKK